MTSNFINTMKPYVSNKALFLLPTIPEIEYLYFSFLLKQTNKFEEVKNIITMQSKEDLKSYTPTKDIIQIISTLLELRIHLRIKKSAYSEEADDSATTSYDRIQRRQSSAIMTNIVPALSPDDPLTYQQYIQLVYLFYYILFRLIILCNL